jgi:SAM-dependent methyltransferase
MTTVGTRQRTDQSFFAEPVREYSDKRRGRPIAVLRAGCLTPLGDLGLERLTDIEFSVSEVSGDLSAAPLRPRTFDIVYCALFLERVDNVEVVLDRLVGALRPGGLLLVRLANRESAAGLLDRMLPKPVRRALWRRYHPDTPGPLPAVYEQMVSARGMQGYTLMRGLVISARSTAQSQPVIADWVTGVAAAAGRLISRITRGRAPADHDQLLYVIRKPEDRFARVV